MLKSIYYDISCHVCVVLKSIYCDISCHICVVLKSMYYDISCHVCVVLKSMYYDISCHICVVLKSIMAVRVQWKWDAHKCGHCCCHGSGMPTSVAIAVVMAMG